MIGTLILAVAMTTGMELTRTSRNVSQDRGTWVVSYRLKSPLRQTTFIRRSDVVLTIDGTASNSAVPGDGSCREFHITASEAGKEPGHFGRHIIRGSPADTYACKMAIRVDLGEKDLAIAEADDDFGFRVFIEHDHCVYGIWEPILGKMTIDVDFGGFRFRDNLDLENPKRAAPSLALNIPLDVRDSQYSNSAPNSLYFASHDPCKNNVSVNNIPVRYGTKLQFSFRYLVAVGTEGEPRIDLTQESDFGSLWRRMYDADSVIFLTTVGRWQRYSGVVIIGAETSLLDLRFRISSSDVGEVWIADLQLREIGFSPSGNP